MADSTTLEEKLAEETESRSVELAGEQPVGELVEWALPIQERHLTSVRDGSLELAADEDPNA